MSGMWVFKNGVMRLVNVANRGGDEAEEGIVSRDVLSGRRKVLVHTSTNEVITSYDVLESKLYSLGWERYNDNPDLLQFHKPPFIDLISLPTDFNKLKPMHMYDIVVKNKNIFVVRDM